MASRVSRRIQTHAVAAALIALATAPSGATTKQDGVAAAPDYAHDAAWLCRPDREDACAVDLDAAVVFADGSVEVERHAPMAAPAVDCFYVYPTVSRDPGVNSDLEIGPEERAVAAAQLARFSQVCRPFAPLYRQVTLAALRAAVAGEHDPITGGAVAYGDVRDAWRHYMEYENNGRGVILIGHSQGARMLHILLSQEIENGPALETIVAAYLIGMNVQVPEGETVGGDFSKIPVCTAAHETGCLVSYVTFRDTLSPPANTRYGRAPAHGMAVVCVNPARPGSDEITALEPYLSNPPDGSGAESWTAGAAINERFVKLPGFLSAQCVDRDGAQYLSLTVNADPKDPRTDALAGDVEAGGQVIAGWGLHRVDMHVAMGDLVRLAERQVNAYEAR